MLMKNWAPKLIFVVRAACSEKCDQLPCPKKKPNMIKPDMTINLVDVSTFCTLAVGPTPRQLRIVKTAIREEATACAGPRRMEKAPDPSTKLAWFCLSAGKK